MFTENTPTFSLDNFEGPLELLLYLIQKDEIDICSIAIRNLTAQFMENLKAMPEVEMSSETLALAASLLLIKSQKLLPDENSISEEFEGDPRLDLIQSLIEYCRFKEAAKVLSLKEEEQKAVFSRATSPLRKELGTGLEDVGIDHLKSILLEMIEKSANLPRQIIKEEEWQVSHKLKEMREVLRDGTKILFDTIFSEKKERCELIVFFLALLELMKHQEARVVRENEIMYIISYEPRT